ncbi:hypothetical protein KK062_00325 [Fulvivirgaceae bacterium PWU5]|uniref:Tetratricopeptide repeat protein n=1 Tax=Dawidia cretensis TaxID=2782350 RepID=A0AAP2DUY3_9BACT|nr:hypothetical protein [Dawidia cretensis]MBT1706642.1 hypothetical protein [Dawidia cretensis]
MSTPEKEKSLFSKRTLLGFVGFTVFIVVLSILFPIDHFRYGVENYNKKNYEAAYTSLTKVRQEDPNYGRAAAILVEIKPKVDSLQRVDEL